jgi:hypothetical protein
MPRSLPTTVAAVGLSALAAFSGLARAATVTLTPSLDNTLYQDTEGALSNALGPNIFAGQTNFAGARRAVLKFDISSIPAGSTITSATLTLNLTRTRTEPSTQTAHRVLASWGEGTSNTGDETDNPGGAGDFSTTNDATWIHRFYSGTNWTTPGGDFNPAASGSALVGDLDGPYTFTGTGLAADVQSWLNTPSTNNGWLIKGDEGGAANAKRFASRNNPTPSLRPALTITFTPPPCLGDLNGDNLVNTTDLTAFLGAFGSTVTPGTGADLNNDGAVNTSDLVIFLARFGQPC